MAYIRNNCCHHVRLMEDGFGDLLLLIFKVEIAHNILPSFRLKYCRYSSSSNAPYRPLVNPSV
uniref:Uncharacterized protein n=1 Tax=Arion vulgaris TaxID=1028688 RepID=A0A0B7AYS8_9EUPU